MSAPWIKIEHGTPEKAEVIAIMTRCGLTQAEAFFACFRVWVWWDNNSRDGNAPNLSLSALENHFDELTRHPGLGAGLTAVGWLAEKDGNAIMPGFDKHHSKSAKTRALTNRRVEIHRERRNAPVTPPPTECNAPVTPPPAKCNAPVTPPSTECNAPVTPPPTECNAPVTPPPAKCNAPVTPPPLPPRYQIREESTDLPPTPSPGEGAFPEISGKGPEAPAEAGPPPEPPPAGAAAPDPIAAIRERVDSVNPGWRETGWTAEDHDALHAALTTGAQIARLADDQWALLRWFYGRPAPPGQSPPTSKRHLFIAGIGQKIAAARLAHQNAGRPQFRVNGKKPPAKSNGVLSKPPPPPLTDEEHAARLHAIREWKSAHPCAPPMPP